MFGFEVDIVRGGLVLKFLVRWDYRRQRHYEDSSI